MTKRGIRRLVAVVLVVAAATWVAALLGFASGFLSDDPPVINPYATAATTSTTTPGPVITIVGQAFDGDTTGTVGDEVTVSNESGSSHTWTARDGTFRSGTIVAGGSFTFVFDRPGTYEFFCEFHPAMSGTITITG